MLHRVEIEFLSVLSFELLRLERQQDARRCSYFELGLPVVSRRKSCFISKRNERNELFGSRGDRASDKIEISLRAASQFIDEGLLRKSKLLLENVNNKSPSAVRSERKSWRVNMTVRLSF